MYLYMSSYLLWVCAPEHKVRPHHHQVGVRLMSHNWEIWKDP